MKTLPEYKNPTGLPVWQQIYDFYAAFHTPYANHECFYIKDMATTEIEQKFHFSRPYSYWHLGQQVFAAVDDGKIHGFRTLLGDEFEKWSYDNYLYDLLPDEKGDTGYVSMLHYCKNKKSWDDPLFMFKKKLYSQDTLERWEKNYFNQWVDRDKQVMLEEFFGYKARALPAWRRTRLDVDVESIAHGNIFIIAFDDCRLLERPSVEPLRQCEVEYVETRGFPDREKIYQDFWSLVEQLYAFFCQLDLQPIKTFYSKLSWLRDHENTRSS